MKRESGWKPMRSCPIFEPVWILIEIPGIGYDIMRDVYRGQNLPGKPICWHYQIPPVTPSEAQLDALRAEDDNA